MTANLKIAMLNWAEKTTRSVNTANPGNEELVNIGYCQLRDMIEAEPPTRPNGVSEDEFRGIKEQA